MVTVIVLPFLIHREKSIQHLLEYIIRSNLIEKTHTAPQLPYIYSTPHNRIYTDILVTMSQYRTSYLPKPLSLPVAIMVLGAS